MEKNDRYIEVGKFTSPHSFRGEIKLEVWCDSPKDVSDKKTLYLSSGDVYAPFEVEKAREQNGNLIIKLAGVTSDLEAKKLCGRTVFAKRSDFILEEGRFFISDLIGVSVFDADNGKEYGKLTDVIKYGANDVYEITYGEGKKALVPAVKEFVKDIDPEKGIALSPIRGMFDEN